MAKASRFRKNLQFSGWVSVYQLTETGREDVGGVQLGAFANV